MTTVAISQPEHFPYLGFFQKMDAADVFVLLDDVQFSGPRSFQNRNRFRSPVGQDEWFTVPVSKGSYFERLDRVKASADPNWRAKLCRKLHFKFGANFLRVYEPDLLCKMNLRSIAIIRHALKITTPILCSSVMLCDGSKTARIRRICEHVGADTYLCGSGGAGYLDMGEMGNVKVEFFKEEVPDYYTSLQHVERDTLKRSLAEVLDDNAKA
jgi:hypothetical protein